MSIFDRLDLLKYEIVKEVTKEIEDTDFKIRYINENSDIEITHTSTMSGLCIVINEELEYYPEFDLKDYMYSNFSINLNKNIDLDYLDKTNYIILKNRLNELYNKVKLQKDLTEKLEIKEKKEKRSKI